MRVIAGTARHLPLKTIEGQNTRPTTDRIKETLFNMLHNGLYDSRFLDLFAGSGAIGIEALSRGASAAVFAEQNRKAADCIRQNLAFTKLETRARLFQTDVFEAIAKMESEKEAPFTFIFMDPPYAGGHERKVLERLSDSPLADNETLIIVEAALDTGFDYVSALGFEITKYKKYKTNAHVFIKRKGAL